MTAEDAEPVRQLDDAELLESLDFNRAVVVAKVEGLTLPQATAVVMPSGVTLLGVVQHLAWVEREWFEHCILGAPSDDADIDESFRIDPSTSVEHVIDDYRDTCKRSRGTVAAASSLDVPTVAPHWFFGIVTLRWILLHMIRETARHAGHLDILRELTDGRTGFQ